MKLARVVETTIICTALPTALGFIAYYGFITGYTGGIDFTEHGVREHYGTGVYRYRILGTHLLLMLHQVVRRIHGLPMNDKLAPLLGVSDPSMYHSFFLLNTFFFCLTMFAVHQTYRLPVFCLSEREKHAWMLLIACLIALSQFVVVPYDTLSYFLLATSLYLSLRSPAAWVAPVLFVVVVLGALTRETCTLILSMYAVVCVMDSGRRRRRVGVLAVLVSTFLLVYVCLRVVYGRSNAVGNGITISSLSHAKNIIGLGFALCLVAIILFDAVGGGARAGWLFLLFSLPYLASILLMGVQFEFRLWVPVLLVLILQTQARWPGPDTSTQAQVFV